MAEDLVTCLICGHSAQTLARHLKAAHVITAEDYRQRYPGARIRSEACEASRRAAQVQAHADNPRSGLKKTVVCPCGASHEVGLTSASKDLRCPTCKARDAARAEEERWAGKEEGQDYVVCVLCGHRAENLTSHVGSAHNVGYPAQAPMVAQGSAVRDKTALKGRPLSEETRARMSASAGWNRGLTKETDSRVARAAAAMEGRQVWNSGLTKEDHPSLQSTSVKLSVLKTGQPSLNKADLSQVDFTPFLDATGAVDRKTMAEELGLSEPTVTKYMEELGLRLSDERRALRVERDLESGRFFEMSRKSAELTRVVLTVEQLEPYRQLNGKVVLAHAMRGLGHTATTIRKECVRLGLPVRVHAMRQILCLEAIKDVLGGVPYVMEWRSMRFTNPPTGHQFRYDGYFPSLDLVVEFHGYQHWTFPSVFIQKREIFDALVERDRVKAQLIEESEDLHLLVLREDEPYTDPVYLRERLLDVLPV